MTSKVQEELTAASYMDTATDGLRFTEVVPLSLALEVCGRLERENKSYLKCILDAEEAAEAAGRPEGEYLARSIEAFVEMFQNERDKSERLEQQNAAMVTDLEQGFMQGAYARLKNLQEAERRVVGLKQGNESLRAAWGLKEIERRNQVAYLERQLATREAQLATAREALERIASVKEHPSDLIALAALAALSGEGKGEGGNG